MPQPRRPTTAKAIDQDVLRGGMSCHCGRSMDAMMVELLVVPDCPHEPAAAEVLRTALDDIGPGSVDWTVTVIETQEAAERRHFTGSPTICVDGKDLFDEPDRPASVVCRIYPGPRATPDLRDLRQALKQAAASTARR